MIYAFNKKRDNDDLYQSSRPECTIFLSNNSVYVNEKTVEVAITFKNAEDKQNADAVEITLTGSNGVTFLRCDKKIYKYTKW